MRVSKWPIRLLWVLCAATTVHAAAPAVPGFELRDQHGRLHEVAFPMGRVSVIAFADQAGSRQLDGWVRPLYERYRDGIDIRGVARLAGVPAALRGVLRALFRRTLDYPVMLDWTGAVSSSYGCDARGANLVVLSPAGGIEGRFNGRATPSVLKQCFERIDRLLRAPRAE